MRLYLVRHGEAGWEAPSDEERTLTSRGQDKTRLNLESRSGELESISHVFCSPLVRARQTADIVLEEMPHLSSFRIVDWLVPDANPATVAKELQEIVSDVLLVSHQPFCSIFAEWLCDSGSGAIAMGTSSIVAMEMEMVARAMASFLWKVD
jgi:phosphohistidine phosphatase SixA